MKGQGTRVCPSPPMGPNSAWLAAVPCARKQPGSSTKRRARPGRRRQASSITAAMLAMCHVMHLLSSNCRRRTYTLLQACCMRQKQTPTQHSAGCTTLDAANAAAAAQRSAPRLWRRSQQAAAACKGTRSQGPCRCRCCCPEPPPAAAAPPAVAAGAGAYSACSGTGLLRASAMRASSVYNQGRGGVAAVD